MVELIGVCWVSVVSVPTIGPTPPPSPSTSHFPAPGDELQRGMTKRVHPNEAVIGFSRPTISIAGGCHSPRTPAGSPEGAPLTLTVWRKSLLFNFNGFTVFDGKGNLIFRVDNYTKSGNKGEIVLMDAAGNPLLTLRRKKLSLGEHWQIYEGEESIKPIFSVRKHVNFIQSKSLAHLTPCCWPSPALGCNADKDYAVEGSYSQRSCTVYDERRQKMAEIKQKEAIGGVEFGVDVFLLTVQPGFATNIAMAIVILLEEMFGSKSSLIKF